MAEALALVTSVISVVGAAKATGSVLRKLVNLRHAPGNLKAICNEMLEVEILLRCLQDAAGRADSNREIEQKFRPLLERINSLITKIMKLMENRLIKNPQAWKQGSADLELNWVTYVLEESRVRKLTVDLANARHSAAAALTAISSYELPQVKLSLQRISNTGSNIESSLHDLRRGTSESLNQLTTTLAPYAARIDDIHTFITKLAESHQLLSSDTEPVMDTISYPSVTCPSYIEIEDTTQIPRVEKRKCSCECHVQIGIRTPRPIGALVGNLLMSYTRGNSAESCRVCARQECQSSAKHTLKTQYYFPAWLLHKALQLRLTWDIATGCTMSLRTTRLIPTKSDIFSFAQHGNIKGMQELFAAGLASPLDVTLEEGRSALHFAVTAVNVDMVKFLVDQGVDTELEDSNMLTAQDIIWNYYLQQPGTKVHDDHMRAARMSPARKDNLEKRGFSRLHNIILGLSSLNLEAYLDSSTSDIDVRDSMGKTALCWAASRPYTHIVATLLKYGASPVLCDFRGQTPAHYCAGSGTPESLDLVLKSVSSLERRRSSAGATDFISLEERASIVDAKDAKGRTALNFAVRMNFPVHIKLLLNFGADIDGADGTPWRRTPLMNAVYWKSHTATSVLLENGASTTIEDGNGGSLLHVAAQFGDQQTLDILMASQLGWIDVHHEDNCGKTAQAIYDDKRCVAEDINTRASSAHLFEQLLSKASRTEGTVNGALQEISDSDGEDVFVDIEE